MKNKSIIESKKDGFEGRYKELTISEMMNLRGGDTPPPDPDGADFPIKPTRTTTVYTSAYVSTQPIPVLKTKGI